MLSILLTLATAALGAWLAFLWQSRAQRNERYYTALSERLRTMRHSIEFATPILSNRIYAIQRLVLNIGDDTGFQRASHDEREASLSWNTAMMQIELSVQLYFHEASLYELENWQSALRKLPVRARAIQSGQAGDINQLLSDTFLMRRRIFEFIRQMIRETKQLDEQIHFGIKLDFATDKLIMWSTSDLLKNTLFPNQEFKAVVRQASDFLEPLGIRTSRTRVN